MLGPDSTVLTVGYRVNTRNDTDMTLLAFDSSGVPDSTYNFVGFVIDDGASAERSYESGKRVLVLSSGAIWALGSSSLNGLLSPDIPTVWVDRDPARAFPPLGN